jgi:hypothetical protein
MKKAVVAVCLFILAGSAGALAQDAYIELLRSDIKAEKVALITEIMQFSDEEGGIFWPIYRRYQLEFDGIMDERIALIKDYAENFDTMTDEKAKELLDQALAIDAKRGKLTKKYFRQMDRELPTITVAKFLQLDRQINLLMDLQIATELPLIE